MAEGLSIFFPWIGPRNGTDPIGTQPKASSIASTASCTQARKWPRWRHTFLRFAVIHHAHSRQGCEKGHIGLRLACYHQRQAKVELSVHGPRYWPLLPICCKSDSILSCAPICISPRTSRPALFISFLFRRSIGRTLPPLVITFDSMQARPLCVLASEMAPTSATCSCHCPW